VAQSRWTRARAAQWALDQPWWVGCNFTPSTASNQFEMWQPETFDPQTIARELGWASHIGMNTVRVFLHDLVWQADADGFKSRMETFLQLADAVGIRTMFVLFDDCWFPPVAGPQAEPVPGVHNSRWAQSPGHDVVSDRTQWPRLQQYVCDIIDSFGRDERVCVWDLYNEPGNAILPLASRPAYQAVPLALTKLFRHGVLPSPTIPLLRATFEWARSVNPMQPITVGLWAPIPRLNRLQTACSDVISFHHYQSATSLRRRIETLKNAHGRPVICTEWMARPVGSRVETHLPVFQEQEVGCYCWGLVSGRTQTIHRWTDRPGSEAPKIWHHDLLRADGSAFDDREIELMQRLTAASKKPAPSPQVDG